LLIKKLQYGKLMCGAAQSTVQHNAAKHKEEQIYIAYTTTRVDRRSLVDRRSIPFAQA
jgi:hypothetical protein